MAAPIPVAKIVPGWRRGATPITTIRCIRFNINRLSGRGRSLCAALGRRPSTAERSVPVTGLQLPVSVSFNPNSPYVSLPGTIVYAGPAPGQIGLAEIKFQLPLTGPQPTANELFVLLNATITIGPATLSLANIAVK